MIERYAIQMFEDHLFCDTRKTEEMVWDGLMRASNPPQYFHYCPKCGASHRSTTRYPTDVRHKRQLPKNYEPEPRTANHDETN